MAKASSYVRDLALFPGLMPRAVKELTPLICQSRLPSDRVNASTAPQETAIMSTAQSPPNSHTDDLRTLAECINDNANVARRVIALLLLLALYLFLTLVASTDKNLLLDGQVLLPQLGVGLSVRNSYLLAPPVFLYLHVQTMLILTTLARQVRSYDGLVRAGLGGRRRTDQPTVDVRPTSRWNWLSAMPFIQMYVPNTGTSLVSRSLVWLTIGVIPLLLLSAIDLSFLRYQSRLITLYHHSIILLDFLVVWHFSARFRWGLARRTLARQLRAILILALRRLAVRQHVRRLQGVLMHFRHAPALCILALLLAYAHPPAFDIASFKEDRARIWGQSGQGFWSSVFSGHNVLDAGPCKWWKVGCRFLNVREGHPALFDGSAVGDLPASAESRNVIQVPDLTKRPLRFARLHAVDLTEADLSYADLRGAELHRSVFQRSDLSDADLTGAQLHQASLQGANLLRAKLNAADLREANLRGATMATAGLMGANLHRAQLAGADMELTCLAGTNLMSAALQGADLSGAYLQGANLSGAMLHGANLNGANLVAVKLGIAVLDGANLRGAELGLTAGIPASLYLTFLAGATYRAPANASETDFRTGSLCPPGLWTLPSVSNSKVTIEEAIKNSLDHVVTVRAKDGDWSMVRNKSHTLELGPKDPTETDRGRQALRDWTVDFACRNRFTALGTLRRWRYTDKMDNLYVRSSASQSVRKALASQRRNGPACEGLASLPETVWESFMLDWK